MSIYGRKNDAGLVLEIHECGSEEELATHFHPSLLELFVLLPDDAEPGDTITDGVAVKPEPPEEPPLAEKPDKVITREQFLGCFTRDQRLAMKALRSSNEDVDDMYDMLESTNHINIDDAENKALFESLKTGGTIDQAALDKIDALRG